MNLELTASGGRKPPEELFQAQVVIIGAGLAGLAAAQALAVRGCRVRIVEARNRLGGRASSFTDSTTGQQIDTCQHVSMGCCTEFARFCHEVGIGQFLAPQHVLYFMTPDGRLSRLKANRWPAPFHLFGSFARAHYLSLSDKLRIAWGLHCLRRASEEDDTPFSNWLEQHGQTPRTTERFWGLVLTSALNETPERIGLRYARKVFVDAFLRDRDGFVLQLPKVPLGRLYGDELQNWLRRHEVVLSLNCAARGLAIRENAVAHVETRQHEQLRADCYLSTVPFDRLLELLPADIIDEHPYFANLRTLETSPITSVHLWYDRPVTDLPHVVLVGCVGQWVFNRGPAATGEQYLQVVISAARQFRGLGHEEIQRRIINELSRLFPAASPDTVQRARVVTEHTATFSAVPGVDRWRPGQRSPIENLFVAGDWTATGWPATMEGAVRSGYLAAEALVERMKTNTRLAVSQCGEPGA